MSWSTKLIQSDAGKCPGCGMALDLYARPVNVREYVCCACNATFSDEYIAGFVAGLQKAAEQCVHPTGGESISPRDYFLREHFPASNRDITPPTSGLRQPLGF